MIKGTTPKHTFTLPFDTSIISKCKVVYGQGGVELFSKRTEDCVLDGNTISTVLTQEETLTFDYHKGVEIQLRVLTHSGEALASVTTTIGIAKCLDNEVLE